MAITLSFDDMNASVQIGDIVYYSFDSDSTGGFNHLKDLTTTKKLGVIVGGNSNGTPITNNSITVDADNPPPADAFISFAKDKRVNTSSLLGYYADVKFVNTSKEKAELFSVSSGITESSK